MLPFSSQYFTFFLISESPKIKMYDILADSVKFVLMAVSFHQCCVGHSPLSEIQACLIYTYVKLALPPSLGYWVSLY
jgi:hypothetical protein